MHTHSRKHRGMGGFTLVGTLVTLAIAGILSSIAYPSYVGVMHKAHRFDAATALMSLHLAQERHRANNRQYAGQLATLQLPALSPAKRYVLSITSSDAHGFVAVAVATGPQFGDGSCRYLQLTVHSMQVTRASGEDASVRNGAAENRQCWRV